MSDLDEWNPPIHMRHPTVTINVQGDLVQMAILPAWSTIDQRETDKAIIHEDTSPEVNQSKI